MQQEKSKSMCSGCRDDFYNGRQNFNGNECWSFKNAEIVEKVRIHVDAVPPYLGYEPIQILNCRTEQRCIFVKPHQITTGYIQPA